MSTLARDPHRRGVALLEKRRREVRDRSAGVATAKAPAAKLARKSFDDLFHSVHNKKISIQAVKRAIAFGASAARFAGARSFRLSGPGVALASFAPPRGLYATTCSARF